MIRKIAVLFIVIFLPLNALSQEQVKPVLEKGDVAKFIKTFPDIVEDLEEMGLEFNSRSGVFAMSAGARARNRYFAILKTHGWDKSFYIKASAIMRGYTISVYGKALSKSEIEFEKAIRDLDSNKSLSAEMKKRLKEQMLVSRKMMEATEKQKSAQIHPDDKKMIVPHLKKLKVVFYDED